MANAMALRNVLVDATTTEGDTFSLHSADPGTSGTNEISGTSYSRQTVTWPVSSTGSATANELAEFGIDGGTSFSHWGFWNGGTFLKGGALPGPESYSVDGTYSVQFTVRSPQ